jgi:hypothetical protein
MEWFWSTGIILPSRVHIGSRKSHARSNSIDDNFHKCRDERMWRKTGNERMLKLSHLLGFLQSWCAFTSLSFKTATVLIVILSLFFSRRSLSPDWGLTLWISFINKPGAEINFHFLSCHSREWLITDYNKAHIRNFSIHKFVTIP